MLSRSRGCGLTLLMLTLACGGSTSSAESCRGPQEAAWKARSSLCLNVYATNVGTKTRGMAFAPNGDLFVISGGTLYVLYDEDRDGVSSPQERKAFAEVAGLNHGVALDRTRTFIYASTSTRVYRWAYVPGRREAVGGPEEVISGIAEGGLAGGGGHSTRTLAFDAAGRLYVTIGSATNLDTDPVDLANRSQIRRFTLPAELTAPIDYAEGELVAMGLRNNVGITFDDAGRIWGVENSRDDLVDARFGGDIHQDNPAEELNRIDGPGALHYGYPQCWTAGILPGGGEGTQHADLEIPESIRKDDVWCRDPANQRPPAKALPPHWAPLGIVQYTGDILPREWKGHLFLTSHGSWNRESSQVGRLIARAEVLPDGTIGMVEPIIGEQGGDGRLREGNWGVRPVDIQQGPDGALYFSDDLSNRVFRVGSR